MAIIINERNIDALKPIFKPWEEPTGYRVAGKDENSPAIIEQGRRPSICLLVNSIRAEVDMWRKGKYPGVSETSRYLLNFWFNTDHLVKDITTGETFQFRYHWAQREAIEAIIYLYELRNIRSVASLLTEFGNEHYDNIALGINPEDDQWLKCCCKIATGGGKTKVMSLAIVWSYFNALKEGNPDFVKHFVIIAPNLIVYERLKYDFENIKIFTTDPLIPEEWIGDFHLTTILQDEPGGDVSSGAIYLTNIHRLYESRDDDNNNDFSIWGPEVNRNKALDTSIALRERISSHQGIMILNDEAHHLHDPELAWNKAIDSLHRLSIEKGNKGICLQLDYSATPKHNDGTYFRHIICDFPLGEAVDSGIVKVPLLGESAILNINKIKGQSACQTYLNHLKLGYQRYEEAYKQWEKVRKPILFVMTEDTTSANEITHYLDSDEFPLLKGRVLNLHTKLKGRIKKFKRKGIEIKEFIESEKDLKPEELKALREMSRELDSPDSKYRCIVSVMMLREGWDIKNVTTIVPLRPYSAASGILPEQTLGRGLRRMEPTGEIPEMVTVIHHPAFRKLYEKELQLEGFDVLVIPEQESIKQTVTIYVDNVNKNIEALEITIPYISDAIETSSLLENLTIEEVVKEFRQYKKLPIGEAKENMLEFKERHLFTKEIIGTWKLDMGLLENSWSAPQYYALMLAKACQITNYNTALLPVLQEFMAKHLFEREVDLFSGEVKHRMKDIDVQEHILAVFTPLIMDKRTIKKKRTRTSNYSKLSMWKPYQATSTDKKPTISATKTMFNLVPCDNEFEREFASECDRYEDVVAFAKNAGPQKLAIDYLKPDKHRAMYIPDYFVRTKNGDMYLCELKGRVDDLVPLKAKAAMEWCKSASTKKWKWHYLYIPYQIFQQSSANTIEELARACVPSLKNLISEKEPEQIIIDFEADIEKDIISPLIDKILKLSGMEKIPEEIFDSVRQTLLILDHSEKTGMTDFAHAFQPLLFWLDYFAYRILDQNFSNKIPADHSMKDFYFSPDLSKLDENTKKLLVKYGKFLKDNLVFKRPIMKLGTLLFCLGYANKDSYDVNGIWKDVKIVFSGDKMKELYALLNDVNEFRNTRVAHIEKKVEDINEAWQNLGKWVKCLSLMVDIAVNNELKQEVI